VTDPPMTGLIDDRLAIVRASDYHIGRR